MKFKKYSEIENLYNSKFVSKIRDFKFDDPSIEYVVETKIDGSNFQCSIDEDGNFKTGSRNNLHDVNSDFQGSKKVIIEYNIPEKLKQLKSIFFERFLKDHVDSNYRFSLTVYGELCGGYYRHPDVEKVPGVIKIQGRIDYSPKNEWIPFDMIARNEDESIIHGFTQDEVYEYCKLVGLPALPIRFKGTFDECINYSNHFIDDTGHILFGLPIIENNITEGVVIKPNAYMYFPNGERVILKNKNDKFKERMIHKSGPKEDVVFSDLENKWYRIMSEYITESRLYSVISKIQISSDKQFGLIIGDYMKDLCKDFDKDYKDEIDKLQSEVQDENFRMNLIRKKISKDAAELIRPLFIDKLNETRANLTED